MWPNFCLTCMRPGLFSQLLLPDRRTNFREDDGPKASYLVYQCWVQNSNSNWASSKARTLSLRIGHFLEARKGSGRNWHLCLVTLLIFPTSASACSVYFIPSGSEDPCSACLPIAQPIPNRVLSWASWADFKAVIEALTFFFSESFSDFIILFFS